MILNVLALSLMLSSSLAAQEGAAKLEPLDAIYEAAVAKKDDAAIESAFKARRFEVINLVDGYLEGWLSNVEGSAKEKAADPQVLMDRALDAAARGDKALGGDGYTRYAKAWKNWTPEQQKQFRKGQEEYQAGRGLQKEKKLADAKARYEASLALAAPLGDLWGEAQAHQSLGDLAFGEEKFDVAIEHHKKGKAIFGSIRHQGAFRSYRALANAYEKKGDLKAARKELEEMVSVATEAKLPHATIGPVHKDLARVCRALGDEDAAKAHEAKVNG